MSTNVRNTNPLAATSNPVTSANASDLATSLTLANEIKGIYEDHVKDDAKHKLPLAITTLVAASTLATGITLGNAIKTAYNIHRASTTYHYTADATNVVASADATDQSSLNTLLNEIKTDLNAHITSGPTGSLARLVDA
jgi:hypothetical protein